jgi:SpoVK/Ycf46/Vps4 family AAA+-type ATPase
MLLLCRLSSVKHSLTADDIHQLAQHTQGFVGADLAALVNEAALAALRRHVMALQQQSQPPPQQQQTQQQQLKQQKAAGLCVCWQDFEAARLLVCPSALREVAIEVPQVSLTSTSKSISMQLAMHLRCLAAH